MTLVRVAILSLAFQSLALNLFSAVSAHAASIPSARATALDGHGVSLPHDLPAATILILGFGRHSSDATTAWEKPTRGQFGHSPGVAFYDMAMLESVPHFMRNFVVGRINKAVPDVLKPNFLPLFEHESEWKQASGFDPKQEDAAYIMLVDREGNIRWSSHQPYNPALFAQLVQSAQALASANGTR